MGYSLQRARALLLKLTRPLPIGGYVSMGYSLQRPRAPFYPRQQPQQREQTGFQWATHFNAHAHTLPFTGGVSESHVSMGYSLQRPRAPLAGQQLVMNALKSTAFQWATHFNAHAHQSAAKASRRQCITGSFNGLLTSTPTRTGGSCRRYRRRED